MYLCRCRTVVRKPKNVVNDPALNPRPRALCHYTVYGKDNCLLCDKDPDSNVIGLPDNIRMRNALIPLRILLCYVIFSSELYMLRLNLV